MTITLLKCYQCWSFTDDLLIDSGEYQMCSCGCKYVRPVNATPFAIFTYVVQNFRHVCKILLFELREKFQWKSPSQ